jgi:hypothetical protein
METMERIEDCTSADHTHRVTIYSDLQYQRRQCRSRNCVMRAVVKGVKAPIHSARKLLRRSIRRLLRCASIEADPARTH